jgi:hypothetical protein
MALTGYEDAPTSQPDAPIPLISHNQDEPTAEVDGRLRRAETELGSLIRRVQALEGRRYARIRWPKWFLLMLLILLLSAWRRPSFRVWWQLLQAQVRGFLGH